MEIFIQPQHFVIPLFQRPYVWDQDEQWEPLWQDVRRVADLRISEPYLNPRHFLGAVVVQMQEGATGNISARNVIDGQQRLTTLQLFMNGASAALEETGAEALSTQLERLTHNDVIYVSDGENRLKIRHSNKDKGSYDEVMRAEIPIAYDDLKNSDSKISRAHRYFADEVRQWLGEPDDQQFTIRAQALVYVLTQGLQLVTIDLNAAENSQEIFETLNARGTPLTAADLIRNYVFQRLEAEGADTGKAYQHDWPFEPEFWETEISVGRYFVGRSSLFLNQWLVSRTGDDISPQATFSRFKHFVEHESGQKMENLLPEIKAQADLYEAWTLAASHANSSQQLTAVEMAVYRMRANGIEILKPLLIWLHEPGRNLPLESIRAIVNTVESWIVRRLLLRLSGSDLGRIVADIIRVYSATPNDELVTRVSDHLSRLNVTSTYWPGDGEIRSSLATQSAYTKFRRPRLRMLLEAVEDYYRNETNQSQLDRKGYPIEHILPRAWQAHWPVEGIEAQQDRANHVNRLGNLTLLTDKLNPKVSNAAWVSKRKAFLKHNTINMTGRLVADAESLEWNEFTIDSRTTELVDVILKIWPVPLGHKGQVVDPQSKVQNWVEVKHLLGAGLLTAGDILIPRPGQWQNHKAKILAGGKIEVDGKTFYSPSGAAKHVRGGNTNGWKFWRMADGRQLEEVRLEFTGGSGSEP